MKDIEFRAPSSWYQTAADDDRARKLRVIDLVAVCTDHHDTAMLVAELALRLGDTHGGCSFLGQLVGGSLMRRLFQAGDYVLVAVDPGSLGWSKGFKTGFVEATRSGDLGCSADVVFLDGTRGTFPYYKMIWAQCPKPLKAFMDAKLPCVEKCPLKDEGACMRKGEE